MSMDNTDLNYIKKIIDLLNEIKTEIKQLKELVGEDDG